MKSNFVSAIMVAAGNSTRMGTGVPKIFENILSRPALNYTLEVLNRAKLVDEIIIVCKDEHRAKILSLIEENKINKFKGFATGGNSRQQSVFSGLTQISSHTTHVAIHDAARILITDDIVDNVITDAFETKASAVGTPMKDTIKLVDNNSFIVNTVDRSKLWNIQTPQVFEKNLYLSAMESAISAGKDYTDDCQLVENFGKNVHAIMGSYSNLKLTTADDIPIFEAILKKRSINTSCEVKS